MSLLTDIIKPEWIAQAVFFFILGVTVGGAAMAVFLRQIIHNILGLIICLFGVAGIFIYLNAEFLALMEILVYIGAICISIIFAIMLSDPMYKEPPQRDRIKMIFSGGTAVLIFLSLSSLIFKSKWTPAEKTGVWDLKSVGYQLLTRFDLVFELISLVLLVAILGAVMIAGSGRKQGTNE